MSQAKKRHILLSEAPANTNTATLRYCFWHSLCLHCRHLHELSGCAGMPCGFYIPSRQECRRWRFWKFPDPHLDLDVLPCRHSQGHLELEFQHRCDPMHRESRLCSLHIPSLGVVGRGALTLQFESASANASSQFCRQLLVCKLRLRSRPGCHLYRRLASLPQR